MMFHFIGHFVQFRRENDIQKLTIRRAIVALDQGDLNCDLKLYTVTAFHVGPVMRNNLLSDHKRLNNYAEEWRAKAN